MQVHRCDECQKIGEPGETWVRVDVGPYYLPGNQQYYDSPMVMEGPGPNRQAIVCSPPCAATRIRRGFEDLATFANGMVEVGTLLDEQFKPRG